ncbi:HIT zinc finger protein [Colletotrichum navitas]|uniref:Box C/D snoRNA protein 1 n=1 Tax=Colletotrichum navitas TaxID=681940 RepID=A0AAD8Q687_9PEZI|nr:HIT zinc finger protein [Colletotrichum navitas]KAK1596008.1 HIT zinc finger protein [Colletotrichum navitas]
MTDPLLTSLCAICHTEPPRYKCPRCTTRTCSLACTKRHKVWSSCNGIRDATAYVPPSKLKTAAGVDHDFNFLSGIERAVQRSEKEIVEERQLLRPEELRPIEVRSVQWKTGRDGRKKRVLVTEVLKGDAGGARQDALTSMPFKKRLSRFGILLRRAPVGMVRQRENSTNFSKASGRINWQVEWLLVPSESETPERQKGGDEAKRQTKRILAKAFDDMPLYKAFAAAQRFFHDEQARKERQRQQRGDDDGDDEEEEAQDGAHVNTGRSKKRRKHQHKPGQSLATAQNTETGSWHPGRFCMQTAARGAWTPHTGVAPYTGTTKEEEAQKGRYAFYLAGTTSAATSAAGQTVVHAVDAAAPLGDALRDITVLEFPTLYVVEAGAALPSFLLEEAKPVRLVPQKRKPETQVPGKKGGAKGGKRARRHLEDGELPSDGEESDVPDGDVDRFAAAVEQIIAEESLGEEDDDSTTSSSGSDSESDEYVKASLAAKLALLKGQQA